MIFSSLLKRREAENDPIRVGLIGAGYAARGFALQCVRTSGMRLSAVANRTPERAFTMLLDIGVTESFVIGNKNDIAKIPPRDRVGYTDDPQLLLNSDNIDVIVEATGDVEFGSFIALEAIKSKKHIIVINAELDATVGVILKKKADAAGVVYSQADGDQPGVIINLFREAQSLGLQPVVAGNIKTYFDHYRNPDIQKKWSKENDQSPTLATSAVDGTKLSAEMASVANAVGFAVTKRGMNGFRVKHVDEAYKQFDLEKILNDGGIVDYILGAQPAFGVFVIAYCDNLLMRTYLKLYKMGDGPFYTLYKPYHLCSLEAHYSVVKAVLQGEATLASTKLNCEVIAIAKRNLHKDEKLDGIGGFMTYGSVENSNVVQKDQLLPIGLSKDCVLKRPIAKDQVITLDDVVVPPGRLVDKLYKEQIENESKQ